MCDLSKIDEIKNDKFSATLIKLMEAEEEIEIFWERVKEDIVKSVGVEDINLKILDMFF